MTTPEALVRATVPALDEILGRSFPVLDAGFVRVIDYMGGDESIVQAARVSYGRGTKRVHEDRGIVRYLMRHSHTTPFEMCELKLHVRVPMDCWRQWIRHRTANVNEYSTRYSVAIDAMQVTPPASWRMQASTSRQGSDGTLDTTVGDDLSRREEAFQQAARRLYEDRLALGVAREQARKDLPLSTYTEAYWKTDLHNLLHFLRLRMDSHAQHEIREYANVIGREIVARWVPVTWEAFEDYRRHGTTLSRTETEAVRLISLGDRAGALLVLEKAGWLGAGASGALKRNRERDEFGVKLKSLGLPLPWPEGANAEDE